MGTNSTTCRLPPMKTSTMLTRQREPAMSRQTLSRWLVKLLLAMVPLTGSIIIILSILTATGSIIMIQDPHYQVDPGASSQSHHTPALEERPQAWAPYAALRRGAPGAGFKAPKPKLWVGPTKVVHMAVGQTNGITFWGRCTTHFSLL